MKKSEKYFNDKEYGKLHAEAQEAANRVLDGIAALREEGLPTDKESVEKLTSTPDALKNFLRESANNQIGKGYVAPDERSRIYEVYSHLLARIQDRFELMRVSLPQVPLVFDGDSITVDWDKLEKKAKAAATYEIDAEGLEAWWEKVAAVRQALDGLKEHEEKNGLPDFEAHGIHHMSELGNFLSPTLHDFFTYQGKKETFAEMARSYFLKKL